MIKDKRGLDYIDWTLSMGLFLIIVVALFVFLKPGAEPAFSGDNLLDIVETNLLKDTGSVIKETPLLVKKLNGRFGSPSADALVTVRLNSDWIFKEIDPPAVAAYFESVGLPSRSLVFNCHVGSCSKNFVLRWLPSKTQPTQPILTIKCKPPSNSDVCDAVLGSTVNLEGIDPLLVAGLSTKGYEVVKTEWHFPKEKDFAIRVDNLVINGTEPGPQANVIVKELKYWAIIGSARTPVIINLRVW